MWEETEGGYLGSSPHTRGAHRFDRRRAFRRGIIPAYAGSTRRSARSPPSCADHPRIRGEHERCLCGLCGPPGSSPHTRGAHEGSTGDLAPYRIIPAYAGSTKEHSKTLASSSDHPRIRGEHRGGNVQISGPAGSSPHTRGALGGAAGESDPVGIIPAYAGSTSALRSSIMVLADHPRIRGEHTYMPEAGFPVVGSSPHTRGAPTVARRTFLRRGIIPAYAGSTIIFRSIAAFEVDHPRIRGEHSPLATMSA